MFFICVGDGNAINRAVEAGFEFRAISNRSIGDYLIMEWRIYIIGHDEDASSNKIRKSTIETAVLESPAENETTSTIASTWLYRFFRAAFSLTVNWKLKNFQTQKSERERTELELICNCALLLRSNHTKITILSVFLRERNYDKLVSTSVVANQLYTKLHSLLL